MAHIKKFTDDIAKNIINKLSDYPIHDSKDLTDPIYFNYGEYVFINKPNDYERQKYGMIGIKRNTITLVGVIINISDEIDLSIDDKERLQIALVQFLLERYDYENVISAICNRNALKFYFMPIVSSDIGKNAEAVDDYVYYNKTASNSEVARALGISRDTVRRWRNKGYYKASMKLSAKRIVTRQDLRTFHKDLANYLDDNFETRYGEKVGKYFYFNHDL